MKIKIENCHILTMANPVNECQVGDIGIEDDRIAYIGDVPGSFKADKVIDGTDTIAMPGLINTHTHIAMSLMRNYADDLPFWPWLTEKIWPVEEKLTASDVYWGSLLSIAEMIRSGITAFADMYFFTEETVKAVSESGMRANLSRGLVEDEDADAKLQENVEVYNRYHDSANGRIKIDLGPHAPYSCGPDFLKKVIDTARDTGMNLHIHLSETKKEVEDNIEKYGTTPIAHVDRLGLFDVHTLAAHCVYATDEDIEILSEKGVSVLNNPGSNLKLGNGFAPIAKMIESGVNVCLGTDGSSSNNNLNMFEEMNLAALINKAIDGDTTVVPAYTALKMATVNGAIALGVEDEVGTLEMGKKADLILVDMTKPHFYPRFNLMSSLVYSAQASDVKTVLCDGKILMEDWVLKVMDEKQVMIKANEVALKLTSNE